MTAVTNHTATNQVRTKQGGLEERLHYDRFFYFLLGGLTLIHLGILLTTSLDLVSDEALYWEYSKHLDWSFYAKGPAIGIATWLSTALFGDTMFGVRIGAVVCFSIFSAAVYYFVRNVFSPALALTAFLLVRVTPIFAHTGFIMTTDALVLPFWLGSLIFAYLAVMRDAPRYWAGALFLVGLAMLAKYTAAILVIGYGALLLFSRERRQHLLSGGWWIGVLLFFIGISPILIWNAEHNWVNIGHNASHTVSHPQGVYFQRLPELILAQFGLVGPIVFPLLCLALWRGLFRWLRKSDLVTGLWVMTTLPLLVVCVAVTATRACYANWPLPAYVGGLFLVLDECRKPTGKRWLRRAIMVNALLMIPLLLAWYSPALIPDSVALPTPIRRMVGWTELGASLAAKAQQLRESGTSEQMPFIMALDYMTASSLRFSVAPEIEVRLGSFSGRRLTDQDFWQSWPELTGADAIVVSAADYSGKDEVSGSWFRACDPLTLDRLPPPNRLAKPFSFLFCKDFNGQRPNIARAW